MFQKLHTYSQICKSTLENARNVRSSWLTFNNKSFFPMQNSYTVLKVELEVANDKKILYLCLCSLLKKFQTFYLKLKQFPEFLHSLAQIVYIISLYSNSLTLNSRTTAKLLVYQRKQEIVHQSAEHHQRINSNEFVAIQRTICYIWSTERII